MNELVVDRVRGTEFIVTYGHLNKSACFYSSLGFKFELAVLIESENL